MPIVITPTGEYINSETGNPVNLPPQRPDIPQTMGQQTGAALTPEEINMGRENIPTNMDMGMDSMMRNPTGSALTEGEMDDVAKVQMLVDMGLTPADAMEAIAREKMSRVNPSAFGGNAEAPNPGMGALSGVQAGNETPMSMPTPRPEDLMMRQMPSGRDRTFNPNDPINRYNAPNT
jgi:hypothetical protein